MSTCQICGERPTNIAFRVCPECVPARLYYNHHYVPLTSREKKWLEFERPPWDWQLYDERGRLVWASELARRYRQELKARQNRDYKEKEYKKRGPKRTAAE